MTPKGGRREGAGRPALPPEERRVKLAHTLDPENLEWLSAEAAGRDVSRSDLLNNIVAGARQGSPIAAAAPVPALAPELAAWLSEYAAQSGQTAAEALGEIVGRYARAMQKASEPMPTTGWQHDDELALPEEVWSLLDTIGKKNEASTSGVAACLIRVGAALLGQDQQ